MNISCCHMVIYFFTGKTISIFFQFKPLEEKVHYYRNVDNALYAHLCYRCDYLVSMPVNLCNVFHKLCYLLHNESTFINIINALY